MEIIKISESCFSKTETWNIYLDKNIQNQKVIDRLIVLLYDINKNSSYYNNSLSDIEKAKSENDSIYTIKIISTNQIEITDNTKYLKENSYYPNKIIIEDKLDEIINEYINNNKSNNPFYKWYLRRIISK